MQSHIFRTYRRTIWLDENNAEQNRRITDLTPENSRTRLMHPHKRQGEKRSEERNVDLRLQFWVTSAYISNKAIHDHKHMPQGLRNRSAIGTSMRKSQDNEDVLMRAGAGLSASAMINASPSQQGTVFKLQVPLLYSVLPAFLQRIICSWSCLACLAPIWKERYLIQIGNFLYRFEDSQSKTPKGAPVALDSVQVRMASSLNEDGMEFAALPPGVGAVFCVSTYRKRQYYAVSSREETVAWTNSIRDGREEATRRSMGHTQNVPYPKSWEYFDNLGMNYLNSKERIKSKLAEKEAKEMEMTNFVEGGPIPRGYFG